MKQEKKSNRLKYWKKVVKWVRNELDELFCGRLAKPLW